MQRERGLTTKLVVDFDIRMQKVPLHRNVPLGCFCSSPGERKSGLKEWAIGKAAAMLHAIAALAQDISP